MSETVNMEAQEALNLGRFKDAVELLTNHLDELTRMDSSCKLMDKILILQMLGRVHFEMNRFQKSLSYYQQALQLLESNQENNSQEILKIKLEITKIRIHIADFKKCEEELDQISQALRLDENKVEERLVIEQLLTEGLFNIYYSKRYEDALKILKRAEDIIEKHPEKYTEESIRIYCYIARCEHELVSLEGVKRSLEKVYNLVSSIYGTDHYFMIEVYSLKGAHCHQLDSIQESIEFYEKSILLSEKIFGEFHSSKALNYDQLSLIWCHEGEMNKMLECSKKAEAIYLELYQKDHPVFIHNNLHQGFYHYLSGNYKQAKGLYLKSLEQAQKVFGDNHLEVACCYSYLTHLLIDERIRGEALGCAIKAFDIMSQYYNGDHQAMAETYYDLALAYYHNEDSVLALEYQQKALNLRLRTFGENHSSIARIYNSLALVYGRLNNQQLELEYLLKSHRLRKILYGKNHKQVSYTYYNLGTRYEKMGLYEKAIKKIRKGVAIYSRIFGESHIDLAMDYNLLGKINMKLGKDIDALSYFFRSLRIRNKAYTKPHSFLHNSFVNLGNYFRGIGNLEYEQEFILKAISLTRKFEGGDHHLTFRIRDEEVSQIQIDKNNIQYKSLEV